jgi:CheY-like chemotaxis protein
MQMYPILFVDDDIMYLRLFQSVAEDHGLHAHYASSGRQALEMLQANHYEVMVTDHNMPGMTGCQLAQKARELVPPLQVSLLTGDISEDLDQLAAQAGIGQVLRKPSSVAQIIEILDYLVDPSAGA